MEIRPIRNESDYQASLKAIDRLMDADEGSVEADRLDVLTTLVEAYEDRVHPIEAPDPVEAIRHALEACGYSEEDLRKILHAERVQVSEILERKRYLTLPMIRRLHRELRIPAETLIQSYELERGGNADYPSLPRNNS